MQWIELSFVEKVQANMTKTCLDHCYLFDVTQKYADDDGDDDRHIVDAP